MTRRGRPRHPDILTPREWEVLDLLRQGFSNEDIAERLGISRDGAKYHVSQILSKLGVSSREEAAAWRPEETRGLWRWAAAQLALKAAGAAVIVAAVGGLGVLGATAIMLEGEDGWTLPTPEEYPFPTFASAVDWVPAGDITPFMHQGSQPRLTGGEYEPVSNAPDAEVLEEWGFEPFQGDEANGIRLISDFGELHAYLNTCSGTDFWKFEEYDVLDYGWLPPGTYELAPQQAAVCPDGTVASFWHEFYAGSVSFSAGYQLGARGMWREGGTRYEGEIAGRPAVVNSHPTSVRHGVGMAVEYGVLIVSASDMPLEDVLRIAEGVDCEGCGPPR